MGYFGYWTTEEDAILYANYDKTGIELEGVIPNRSRQAINMRRHYLGITKKCPQRRPRPPKREYRDEVKHRARPLTEESAYHIRCDYAAKIKLGYTHEKAVDWLVEANTRNREIIEDVLTNPKYDAEVAICKRRSKYTL